MEKIIEGSMITGKIEGYTSEGLGILRHEGRVFFVEQAVRGETVRCKVTKVMKSAVAAKVVEVLEASPERTKPECPYFGICGGCDFQHLSYPEELYAKKQRVQDALQRIGGSEVQLEGILGAKNPMRYRNKSQYPVGKDGTIGFFRERSHEVIPIKSCLIQSEISDLTGHAVSDWMKRYHITPYDETTGKGLIRHVYVRVNQKGESLCCIVANGKQVPKEPELVAMVLSKAPKTKGVILNTNTLKGNVVLGDKYHTLWGDSYLMDTLCGLQFKLSVPSFYQVNHDQAEVLYNKALEYAGLTGNETVLDLYCGTGTITLCLAKKAKKVYGAEIVPPAIRDANENAKNNDIENVEFFCGDASDVARRFAKEKTHLDVITVDPPRKGLAPDVIESIVSMGPERVVYVSCDPATLGRDVKQFELMGYKAEKAVAVDLFPATRHVESVCLLIKQNCNSKHTISVGLDTEEYYSLKINNG